MLQSPVTGVPAAERIGERQTREIDRRRARLKLLAQDNYRRRTNCSRIGSLSYASMLFYLLLPTDICFAVNIALTIHMS